MIFFSNIHYYNTVTDRYMEEEWPILHTTASPMGDIRTSKQDKGKQGRKVWCNWQGPFTLKVTREKYK